LVAASLHLSITTVSGDRALTLDENLALVPGAASATSWILYLPTPDPVGALVAGAAAKHDCLSTAAPPTDASKEQQASSVLDLGALARRED
jgi:hypothetical protein